MSWNSIVSVARIDCCMQCSRPRLCFNYFADDSLKFVAQLASPERSPGLPGRSRMGPACAVSAPHRGAISISPTFQGGESMDKPPSRVPQVRGGLFANPGTLNDDLPWNSIDSGVADADRE